MLVSYILCLSFNLTKINKIIIGIQGDRGSTNEKACNFFAEKYKWGNFDIKYLISTEAVLTALENGQIQFGTFAWSSSRYGLVEETQKAVKHHKYQKVDEQIFQLDHALLSKGLINPNENINIISHPQALNEHKPYLEDKFRNINLIKEIDTAVAAKNLSNDKYPLNSLVIAPIECSKIYHLDIYEKDLPTNQGYQTTIFLVQKANSK
jgi:prephenate dehydratase